MIDKTDSATAQPMDEILDPFGEAWLIAEHRKVSALNAELLEALEDCRDVLEDYAHIVPFLQARERAEAAIAKAKGEK